MCRWQEGHGKRAERGPRHRVGNRRRVSKGRQLSMREHGYRRGALGTSISTCLVPGGAAGGGVRRTRTLARQAPSQHPPEFGSSLRAEWSLERPCPAPPRPAPPLGCSKEAWVFSLPFQRGSLPPLTVHVQVEGNPTQLLQPLQIAVRVWLCPCRDRERPGKGENSGAVSFHLTRITSSLRSQSAFP